MRLGFIGLVREHMATFSTAEYAKYTENGAGVADCFRPTIPPLINTKARKMMTHSLLPRRHEKRCRSVLSQHPVPFIEPPEIRYRR